MKIDNFDFDLPQKYIAQRPVSPRDSARLLYVSHNLFDRNISDLPNLLRAGDLLVFNDTRVFPARLLGWRDEVKIELTLHKEKTPGCWYTFARPARRLKPGHVIIFSDDFSARVFEKNANGEVILTFNKNGSDLMNALETYGCMPLPPYIRKGQADIRDHSDYQTLFAKHRGAIAAPTAGLHFTPKLMEALEKRGINRVYLTLHVGAGTFLPVKVDQVADHIMHAEWGEISVSAAEQINAARASGRRIVAIGTTSLRLLESATDSHGLLHPFKGETDIFITPGYRFKVVDLLLTNFHLPRSTLFMLVCALAGIKCMKAAYKHAIASNYRFYSYGDCCLLERNIS